MGLLSEDEWKAARARLLNLDSPSGGGGGGAAQVTVTPQVEPGVVLWLRFSEEERAANQLLSLPSRTPATCCTGFGEPTWDFVDGRTCMRFDKQQRLQFSVPGIPSGNAPYTIELTIKRQPGKYCGYAWMIPIGM